MAYRFFMDGVELPITPSKLETKIKGNNKTVNLINGGDVNILKLPGLTEISFEALIPQVKYPFAGEFRRASYYTEKLRALKNSKKPFNFNVKRSLPSGSELFEQSMNVSLEDYTITESADNGFDLKIAIKLKQFKEYSTKTVNFRTDADGKTIATTQKTRPAENAPNIKSYTVKNGDTLWSIAKKYLGNGAKYKEIYNLNKDKIKNPNLIYPGQILEIPERKDG